jgi:hypothetical protein
MDKLQALLSFQSFLLNSPAILLRNRKNHKQPRLKGKCNRERTKQRREIKLTNLVVEGPNRGPLPFANDASLPSDTWIKHQHQALLYRPEIGPRFWVMD